jgi:predicted nucleic acid-binding protein
MPARVVDASVLAAIAFAEPRADEAVVLLTGNFLFAPELLPFELCSVAWKKTRRYPEQRSVFKKALDFALRIDVTLVPVPIDEILSLALTTSLAVYDAAYLYVAKRLRCPPVTFDARLARQAV